MKKNNNIFYGVIGVATLMLSIIGATFAYFTATADNNNVIKGNMATIGFDVTVTKMTNVDEARGGLIPMSNNMMEQALTKNAEAADKGICVDDNGNAVCQVYKIIVTNTSSSSMFVDGYVTLTNGSGTPTDVTQISKSTDNGGLGYTVKTANTTTMRWAQAFCTAESAGKVTACTTAATSATTTLRSTTAVTWSALGGDSTKNDGYNQAEIGIARSSLTSNSATIEGNTYEVIKQNYIRISDHAYDDTSYTRVDDANTSDITSALVYNQYLEANDGLSTNNTGKSGDTYTDAQVFYIVVWLSENGKNQTAITGDNAATSATNFFQGKATFITAQGNEVTATFNGLTKVTPNT